MSIRRRRKGSSPAAALLLASALFFLTAAVAAAAAADAGGGCADTKCGGAAERCCAGSPALQRNKDACAAEGSACDGCCGWRPVYTSEEPPARLPAAAAAWVRALGLRRQAFGYYFGATYDSELEVRGLPAARFPGGARSLSGEIYNLFAVNRSSCGSLKQGGFPLHRLSGDEIYHYYAGDGPLTLFVFDLESAVLRNVSIGAAVPGRDRPQYTIPGGTWTGALLAPGATWALTGASTVPGFDPRDSFMASDNASFVSELRALFPHDARLIDRLVAFH